MKKLLALVLALVMTLGLATVGTSAAFSDADSIKYKEAVDVMSAIGVIAGMDNGAFNPAGTLTREQGAKIISYMLLGGKTAGDALTASSAPFSDVAADRWSAGAIQYCVSQGIINGVGDNKFNPTGELTGYAFAKMLLTALGYDSKIEGLVGNNWQVNTAKLLQSTGLAAGVDIFVGSNAVSREVAAQMGLNTLKGTMVYYTGAVNVSTSDGTDVTVGATLNKTLQGSYKQYDAIEVAATPLGEVDTYAQFCEFYFGGDSGLKLYTGVTADGRTAEYWGFKKEAVTERVATDDVLATSNNGTTYSTDLAVATDSDYIGYEADTSIELWVNGAQQAGGTTSVRTTTSSGTSAFANVTALAAQLDAYSARPGVILEFVDTDDNNKYDVVNVIDKKVARLNADASVKTIANGDDQVVVPGVPGMGGASSSYTVKNVVGYEGLAKGDVVLYYQSADSAVMHIEKATSVEGIATARIAGTYPKLTVGGTSYKATGLTGGNFSANVANDWDDWKSTFTFYLDNANNIVYTVEVSKAESSDYAFVKDAAWHVDSSLAANNYAEAELVFADATSKVVKVSEIDGNETSSANAKDAIGKWATYEVDSNGEYVLTTKTTANTGAVAVTGNQAAFVTGYTGNANTKFIVETLNSKGKSEYKLYEGIKSLPSITAGAGTNPTNYIVTASSVATYVYIDATLAGTVSGNGNDYFLVTDSDYLDVGKNGDVAAHYEVKGVLNGEEKTVNFAKNATMNTAAGNITKANVSAGLIFQITTYDADGFVSAVNNTSGETMNTGIKISGGVMTKGDSSKLDVTSSTVFYFVDVDGNVSKVDSSSITNDDTDKVLVTKKNSGNTAAEEVYVRQVNSDLNSFSIKVELGNGGYATFLNSGAADIVDLETSAMDGTEATTGLNKGYVKKTTTAGNTNKNITITLNGNLTVGGTDTIKLKTGDTNGASLTIDTTAKKVAAGAQSATFTYSITSEDSKYTQSGTITVKYTGVAGYVVDRSSGVDGTTGFSATHATLSDGLYTANYNATASWPNDTMTTMSAAVAMTTPVFKFTTGDDQDYRLSIKNANGLTIYQETKTAANAGIAANSAAYFYLSTTDNSGNIGSAEDEVLYYGSNGTTYALRALGSCSAPTTNKDGWSGTAVGVFMPSSGTATYTYEIVGMSDGETYLRGSFTVVNTSGNLG